MIDAESFGEQPILRRDHVLVSITRKLRAQPITRLRRFSGADAVGHDDEMRCRIEWLTAVELFTTDLAAEESPAPPGGAVQNEHRVPSDATRVLLRLTERRVMDAQHGQRRAVSELEVAHLEVTFD